MNKEQRIKELELKQLELQREIEALKKESELPSEWSDELKKQRTWVSISVSVSPNYHKQFIALSKLIILRDIYRESEDEQVDWSDEKQLKYCIVFCGKDIEKVVLWSTSCVLSFTKEETRDLFLKNFESLIIEAKELL